MDFVEIEGDTIDQAIEDALRRLGVGRDKITVEILAEGKKGIFGFGAQKARIRAAVRKASVASNAPESNRDIAEQAASVAESAAVAEKAKTALAEILRLMGVAASVEIRAGGKGDETILEIRADNSGLLIG